jgi:hypothetical protein
MLSVPPISDKLSVPPFPDKLSVLPISETFFFVGLYLSNGTDSMSEYINLYQYLVDEDGGYCITNIHII